MKFKDMTQKDWEELLEKGSTETEEEKKKNNEDMRIADGFPEGMMPNRKFH